MVRLALLLFQTLQIGNGAACTEVPTTHPGYTIRYCCPEGTQWVVWPDFTGCQSQRVIVERRTVELTKAIALQLAHARAGEKAVREVLSTYEAKPSPFVDPWDPATGEGPGADPEAAWNTWNALEAAREDLPLPKKVGP